MKKLVAICMFFLCLAISGYPQSAKDLVLKYRTALGKTVDDKACHTMKVNGDFIIRNIHFPTTIYFKAPHLYRLEMAFQTMTFLQVSNDSLKWEVNPMLNQNTVTRIEKKADGSIPESKHFDFMYKELLNYKELKYEVNVKGKQKMDSVEVYILQLTKNDKTSAKVYLNTENNLIYKIEDDAGYRYFSDYRNTNGFIFPMWIRESSPKETVDVRFAKFSVNEPLVDFLFVIPNEALTRRNNDRKAVSRYVAKGDSLYNAGQNDVAIDSYNKAIQINGKDFLAYNGRGLAKLELGEHYEAIADFTKALELSPSSYSTQNNLGLAKFYLGDNPGALKDYAKALEMNPKYVVTLKNRGVLYMNEEKYELAAQDFAAAAKISPSEGVIYLKLGECQAQMEKYDEAIQSYESAIKNGYATAELYNYRGVSQFKLEKYDTASFSFKKAVELDKQNLQYVENYGRSLYESGSFQMASQQFDTYLNNKKDNPSIYNLNGLCKYNDENYKGAIKDFSKAIELNGKEATYYDNRASAKELIEDYEGAIKDYSESIRVYPSDASVFYKRGLIKIATSKKMEGCLDLATANEMKYEPAKEAIMKNCN